MTWENKHQTSKQEQTQQTKHHKTKKGNMQTQTNTENNQIG